MSYKKLGGGGGGGADSLINFCFLLPRRKIPSISISDISNLTSFCIFNALVVSDLVIAYSFAREGAHIPRKINSYNGSSFLKDS